MSTELEGTDSLTGGVLITEYWGGLENGMCVQLTFPKPGTGEPWIEDSHHSGFWFMQLNTDQLRSLGHALLEVANGTRREVE